MNTTTSTRPIKKNGYSHAKADARKVKRRQEAETRNLECGTRTLKERMDLCCRRRGDSRREFKRLQNRAEAARRVARTPRENVVPSGMN